VKNISKYSLEVVEEWLKNQLNDLKNNIKDENRKILEIKKNNE